MAKENVAKFFEKLASDVALAEKLAKAGEKYGDRGTDEAAVKAATEAVILPIAKEAGFPFTIEEFVAYNKERQGKLEGEVSDDEMAHAAGGCFMPSPKVKEILCPNQGIMGLPGGDAPDNSKPLCGMFGQMFGM